MIGLIVKILLTAVAAYLAAWLTPGVSIRSFGGAVVVAIVLSVLNALLKPILEFVSIPVTILTMGLFLLVINAVIILLAAYLVRSFSVSGFWAAMLYSIVFTLVSWLLEILF